MAREQELNYVRIAESLMTAPYPTRWRDYVRHVMPDLIDAADLQTMEDDGLPKRVCERAAVDVLKLVSAYSVMVTPRGVKWFSFEPRKKSEDVTDDEKDWYQRATQLTQDEIETSNFHTELLKSLIDMVATGDGCLLTEADDRTQGIMCTSVPHGTYRMARNRYGEVDTHVRKFRITAHQAAQHFGAAALDQAMSEALANEEMRFRQEFEVWHLVVPRDAASRGNGGGLKNPKRMPYASVYIAAGSKKVLHEGGYEEFPYLIIRFLNVGSQVYGRSALAPVASIIEDYLEVEEAMKEGAKVSVYPRMLSTPDMASEIDLRAGGVTIVSKAAMGSGLPKEWASVTRYQEGLMQLEQYKNDIDDALYVNQLQSVSTVDRPMSATEAKIRENEKLMTFSQSFTQFAADMRVFMERVFCILWRADRFPTLGRPTDLFERVGPRGEGLKVMAPGVKYIGKMSKALESAKQQGLIESLTFALQMYATTQDPAWLDYFKPYECMQFITDESNVDVGCVRTTSEAKKRAEQRDKMALAQMQMQMAAQSATAGAQLARSEAQTGQQA